MRIEKTKDGRFVKVLSPEMQGMIGRLYKEIQDRKDGDMAHHMWMIEHGGRLNLLDQKIEALMIHYGEVSAILNQMFPEGEENAQIDRSLLVVGYVKAIQFTATTLDEPPLVVGSRILVPNLNAEMVQGHTVADFDAKYAAYSHMGQADGAHPTATQVAHGFMSKDDKTKLDGISIQGVAPAAPQPNHLWVDTST